MVSRFSATSICYLVRSVWGSLRRMREAFLKRGERAVAVAHLALHRADLGEVHRQARAGCRGGAVVGEAAGDGQGFLEGRERALIVVR